MRDCSDGWGCWGWVGRLLNTPRDTPLESLRKQVIVVTCTMCLVPATIAILAFPSPLQRVQLTVFNLILTLCIAYVGVQKDAPLWLVIVLSATLYVFIILNDIRTAASGELRLWPNFILIMDLLLVLQAPGAWTLVFALAVVFYIGLTMVEDATRFGLYDVYLARKDNSFPETCEVFNCEMPPCPSEPMNALLYGVLPIVMFSLDLYLTRYFAMKLIREKEQTVRTVEVVGQIVRNLATFNLEHAGKELDQASAVGKGIPLELVGHLNCLLANLKVYRPYLPHAVLPKFTSTPDGTEAAVSTTESQAGSEDDEVLKSVQTQKPDEGLRLPGYLDQKDSGSPRNDVALELTPAGSVRRVALAVLNLHGSKLIFRDEIANFLTPFSSYLEALVGVASGHRGVTDLFLGDRVFCSFNASRLCAEPVIAAVKAADLVTGIVAPRWGFSGNAAVCTGQAMCSPMGCKSMKRYTVFGDVSLLVPATERLGRKWGARLVCNAGVRKDALVAFEALLLPFAVRFKGKLMRFYELTAIPVLCQQQREALTEYEPLGSPRSTPSSPLKPPARDGRAPWMLAIDERHRLTEAYNGFVWQYVSCNWDGALDINTESGPFEFPRAATVLNHVTNHIPPDAVILEL
ncbi:hypothetical protein DIPPA_34128 [Diplonema papillatum]|nr:hypothetical protein DIPPA_34128 [Diplonema papillatum]